MDDKSSSKTVEMDGLPFNREGGFGGVDATQAIFEPRAIRTNLFEFGTDGGVRDIRWQSAPGSTDQFAMARVRVPWFLDFSWSTRRAVNTFP